MEQKNFVGLINFIFRDIRRMRLILMTKVDDIDSENVDDGYSDNSKSPIRSVIIGVFC